MKVELFYSSKLKVSPCLGDFNCWIRTPSKSAQNDDMNAIVPEIGQADIVVFAAPVYVDGMPGPMKNIVDRLIPLLESDTELREGHCCPPTTRGS